MNTCYMIGIQPVWGGGDISIIIKSELSCPRV